MSENKEMMVVNTADIASVDMMDSLMNPGSKFYCSIKNDGSRASAIKIFNAINSAEEKLDDHINEVLKIVDVVAHPITITDEKTGELIETVRVVLIDEKGNGYAAVSEGIMSSLTKMFAIVGQPSYNPPLSLKVVKQQTRSGFKTNTIQLV